MAKMPGKPPSKAAMAGAVATFLLAVPTLGACSSDDEQYQTQDVYVVCVNKLTGEVVAQDLCPQLGDNDGDDDDYDGTYWYHSSSTYYAPGTRVPAGSTYINPRSSKARTSAGLPAKGKVSGKTTISGGGKSGSGSTNGNGG